MTDYEIRARMKSDPEAAPELDDAWFAHAIFVAPGPKQLFSLRIDSDVLAWFKAHGKGYQTRINAVLRTYFEAQNRRR